MKIVPKYVIANLLLTLACTCFQAQAQRPADIVKWSASVTKATPTSAQVLLSATVADGWHVYALSQPVGGPTPLKISTPAGGAYQLQGSVADAGFIRHFDSNFNMETLYYLKAVNLSVALKAAGTSPAETTPIDVRFQACSDRLCLPPYIAHLSATLKRK